MGLSQFRIVDWYGLNLGSLAMCLAVVWIGSLCSREVEIQAGVLACRCMAEVLLNTSLSSIGEKRVRLLWRVAGIERHLEAEDYLPAEGRFLRVPSDHNWNVKSKASGE